MRHRHSGRAGVENAVTCISGARLPAIPAAGAAPGPAAPPAPPTPAGLREQFAKTIVGRGKGQAADEQFVRHRAPPKRSPAVDDTPWNAEDSARAVVW